MCGLLHCRRNWQSHRDYWLRSMPWDKRVDSGGMFVKVRLVLFEEHHAKIAAQFSGLKNSWWKARKAIPKLNPGRVCALNPDVVI